MSSSVWTYNGMNELKQSILRSPVVVIATLSTVHAAIPGYTQNGGQTRLLGSSFGVPGINATFDYVIVGGGTAGLTIAARLTEDPNLSVAVVEAGGFYELDNGNVSQIPAYSGRNGGADPSQIQPAIDWGIVSTPQTQLGGRSIFYAQGKCLGGSSARNVLAFHRGSKGSYEKWADEVGDKSFTFDNLLPFFQKSVQFTPPNLAKRGPDSQVDYDEAAFSPREGSLQASYANFYQPFSRYVKQAFQKLGFASIPGFNSGSLIGFSEFTYTIDPKAATRSTSETSFLQDALDRPNLLVYQRSLARSLLFNNTIARGVQLDTFGKGYSLSARMEVILSAGVFRTPQLLLASGIGPPAILEKLGILQRVDAPGVGQALQDQPFFGVSYRVNVTTNSELTTNPAAAAQAVRDYLTNQTGRLSSGSNNWIGWEKIPKSNRNGFSEKTRTELATFSADWPEVEYVPSAAITSPVTDNAQYASILVAVSATTSQGTVTINSTDLATNPVIDPQWLATETDQQVAVQALKRAREIAKATGITVGDEFAPGPNVQSDADILAYIKKTMTTFHHAVGTCKMGRKEDTKAVVDVKGFVRGVEKLRIVDASIFPLLPPGHTQATVYALAEKAAADILSGRKSEAT